MKKVVQVAVSEEKYLTIQAIAIAKGVSMSALMNLAIMPAIEEYRARLHNYPLETLGHG